MSALPIEVTPTRPPSQRVCVLGVEVDVGPAGPEPVDVTVGIEPGGQITARRGASPEWFSPLAQVHLSAWAAYVAEHNIRPL